MPVETYPPQLPPDQYARRPANLSGQVPSQHAPATDLHSNFYAAQGIAAGGSSWSNPHPAVPMVSPAATPFIHSAAAVDKNNDEVAVVLRFLEDAGVISSDEPTMTRMEMLYFVKGQML